MGASQRAVGIGVCRLRQLKGKELKKMIENLEIGDRVRVFRDIDCGGDEKWIGWEGVIREIDEYLAEIEIDGQGSDTFQFGIYRLEKL